MNKRAKVKEQFLHEPVTIQLVALVTNLAKISAYINDTEKESLIRHLVDESRFFIDWMAPSLRDFEQQYQLAQYQRQLTQWLSQWETIWGDPIHRRNIATETARWSEQVWQISGLRDTAGAFAANAAQVAAS
ncbi:MAG: hypothetical protein KDE58_08575 [Caldilineaceae bacterium]|nr:hypothetical protein [Caldilineaceae bacterium]